MHMKKRCVYGIEWNEKKRIHFYINKDLKGINTLNCC